LTVDLRQPQEGVVAVRMELPAVATRPLILSSFVQPQAIRVASLVARQGPTPVRVERSTDERGFGRWIIGPPDAPGPLTVDYAVSPGAMEEGKMSGPTGYRFGRLDRSFGLFSAARFSARPGTGSAVSLR
jgi:hypothetical protein